MERILRGNAIGLLGVFCVLIALGSAFVSVNSIINDDTPRSVVFGLLAVVNALLSVRYFRTWAEDKAAADT